MKISGKQTYFVVIIWHTDQILSRTNISESEANCVHYLKMITLRLIKQAKRETQMDAWKGQNRFSNSLNDSLNFLSPVKLANFSVRSNYAAERQEELGGALARSVRVHINHHIKHDDDDDILCKQRQT